MHLFTLFTLLLLSMLALYSSAKNPTTNLISSRFAMTTLVSSSASCLTPRQSAQLPYSLPAWALRERQHWITVANGHPVPTTPPDLEKRQVPIPYIPGDWSTTTQCAALQGIPCTAVSIYLPFVQGEQAKASELAAQASNLANNGAYVPGMDVPKPSEASGKRSMTAIVVAISFVLAWIQ